MDTFNDISDRELQFAPAARLMWRSAGCLQVELGDRALTIEGMSGSSLSGVDHTVLDSLRQAGFVTRVPAPSRGAPISAVDAVLAPDLAALSARFGDHCDGVLEARRTRRVTVQGGGRLTTVIAALLAAAGVTHVHVNDLGEVTLADTAPGGLLTTDEGTRSSTSAAEAIHRAAPWADTAAWPSSTVDLQIVTTGTPVSQPVARFLAADNRPHLICGVWGDSAVIGPLVLPGRSSCLRCADLHRRDRDPAWPALAAQLSAASPAAIPSEIAVCMLTAAVTVLQSLAFLDGEDCAVIDGTLELARPDWRLRRRSWLPHSDCDCRNRSVQ
jgi:hypothetical protein